MSANTRRALSLNDRQDILRKYDQLPKMGQRDAAVRLNISQSVLGRILKNREDIECEALQNESQSRKRKRCGKDDTVERALKEWFVKVRNKDARVSGPLLRQKAEELAEKMGKVDFKATEGWFHRWKKRENICFQKMHGEQGDADFTGAHFWLENEWPSLISEFSPSDVFNADETGLYFRALPEHTYVLQNDKAKGTKSCKERITILCCASMTGEKKKLLVVGKSKQPRCFKGVKALPVDYTANKNAWMTQEIFSQWLIKWDNELDRKIVLLIDNCTAHNVSLNLKNIKLVFLPANTTSLIQPCDQGIIRTLKAYYKLKMRKRVITLIDEMFECESTSTLKANDLSKKINILEALHFVNEAWNNISDVTIRNCFRHGGLVKTEEEEEEEDDHSKDLADKTYEDWMDIDRDLQTSEEYSEDQICQSIINEITNNNDEENDESDEEVDVVVKPPSNKKVLEALDVIRRAVHHRGNNFNTQYEYEQYIFGMLEENKKQIKITNFFQK